ncbi:MAG: hypothetical protein LAP87_30595 [Acidobacteriia bacterium]|nr:hypothetical protein [Terriglobia bacterium]
MPGIGVGGGASQKVWIKIQQRRLDQGKIEKLVVALRSIDSENPEVADKIRTEAEYFERNAERMRYPAFRRQHLFVGSGVIEAGCKTVIGSRLKQSGMFWTVRALIASTRTRILALAARQLPTDWLAAYGVRPLLLETLRWSHTGASAYANSHPHNPAMILLEKFHELLQPWRSAFPQQRTWQRAQRLAYGLLLCLRTHLTSNAILRHRPAVSGLER